MSHKLKDGIEWNTHRRLEAAEEMLDDFLPCGALFEQQEVPRDQVIDDLRAEVLRLEGEIERLKADAARLDYLDGNLRMKMGWAVGKAPAGNLSVSSIIFMNKPAISIRAAIDAAMLPPGPEGSKP